MFTRLSALAAVAVLAMTVALAGPMSIANAETGSKPAKRGNVPDAIDIIGLRVQNADKQVVMRAHVRDLHQRGRFTFQYWRGKHKAPPPRSVYITVRRKDGETIGRFLTCDTEVCLRDTCRGFRAAWRPRVDRVVASMPQRCYPRRAGVEIPKWGRFFVSSRTPSDLDNGPRSPLLLRRG
jgi:hypothetical protein